MAIADSKKIQTAINIVAEEQIKLQAIAARLNALLAAYNAQTPNIAGTILAGKISALGSWVTAVNTAASNTTATAIAAAYVETHTTDALGV